jgi:hypothetical protein
MAANWSQLYERAASTLSGGSQGSEFTSAFGGVAEVHGRTASAAFDANDPQETRGSELLLRKIDHQAVFSPAGFPAVIGVLASLRWRFPESWGRQCDDAISSR